MNETPSPETVPPVAELQPVPEALVDGADRAPAEPVATPAVPPEPMATEAATEPPSPGAMPMVTEPSVPLEPAVAEPRELASPAPGEGSDGSVAEASTTEPALPPEDAPAPADGIADHTEAPTSVGAPASEAAEELSPAATAKRLAELFPALFGPEPKPIKLRIQSDIQARAPGVFSRRSLSLFLHRHTTSTLYLKSLVAHANRYDLDGQPAGDVATEHRTAAEAEVARRKQAAAERRAAERDKALAARREAEAQARREQNKQRRAEHKERQKAWQQKQAEGLAADIERERLRTEAEARRQQQARERPGPGDRAPERSSPRPGQRPADRSPGRSEDRATDRRPERRAHDGPVHGARAEGDAAPQPLGTPLPVLNPEQRERAALLRAYETSTLTRANFLVLKRMTGEQLDEQLALARAEAAARGPVNAPKRPPGPR